MSKNKPGDKFIKKMSWNITLTGDSGRETVCILQAEKIE